MKLPSVQIVFRAASTAFLRFPSALVVAIAGSFLQMYYAHSSLPPAWCEAWILTCMLGLPLFISIPLFAEKKRYPLSKKALLEAAGWALLIAYKYFFIDLSNAITWQITPRFLVVNAGLHLLVAFAPFFKQGEINGFWQFNKSLFIRFSTAFFYSITLFAGIAIGLLAIHTLLGVDIAGKVYFQLWTFIVGVFNTWFFLSGVPRDFEALELSQDYPKGLRIFVQYILVPLVLLYMAILYATGFKILIQWELPRGWLSHLMIGFSIFGILSVLFLHPFQPQEGHRWIKTYARWFYRLLFPLLVILFVAIGKRIADYGFTESRYIVFVLSVWLAITTFYFIFSRQKNIKWIPISLCLISLLLAFGPLNIFHIAELSQSHRLESLLKKNNILVDGKIHKLFKEDAKARLGGKGEQEIFSILSYLEKYPRAFQKMLPWFEEKPESSSAFDISGLMWEDFESSPAEQKGYPRERSFWEADQPGRVYLVRGYDLLFEFRWSLLDSHGVREILRQGDWRLTIDSRKAVLKLYEKQQLLMVLDLMPKLTELVTRWENDLDLGIQLEELKIVQAANGTTVEFYLSHIRFVETKEKVAFPVSALNGALLVKK